jgi:hypothetical protein
MNQFIDIHRPGRRAAAIVTAVSLTALAACGDGDDDATATTSPPDPAPATVVGAIASSPDDPYCDIERQIDAHFVEAFGALGTEATEDQMMQAAQAASAAVVGDGLIEQATAIAPAALAQDLELLTAAVRSAANGDVSGFMTPESDAAGARVDAYCGLED